MQRLVRNVRDHDQLPILRIYRANDAAAYAAQLTKVLLYRTRGATVGHYMGRALLEQVWRGPDNPSYLLVRVSRIELLDHSVSARETSDPHDPESSYDAGGLAETAPEEEPLVVERQRQQASFWRRKAKLRSTLRHHYPPVCAVTGTSRGAPAAGLFAVEACHIVSVRDGGSDDLWNLLFMSRDVHWAFDHGLFTLHDDGEIDCDPRVNDELRGYLSMQGKANFSKDPQVWPKAECLAHHRENVFNKLTDREFDEAIFN